MFKTVALLCATAAHANANANANANTDADLILGGYVPHPVTTANVEWLQIALPDAAHDAHNGTNSICIKHVDHLQTQVVAGTNYRFAVNGCELAPGQYKGYCQQDVQCGRSEFAVTVFSQPWTHTFEVTTIYLIMLCCCLNEKELISRGFVFVDGPSHHGSSRLLHALVMSTRQRWVIVARALSSKRRSRCLLTHCCCQFSTSCAGFMLTCKDLLF